ncbi:DUF6678 family protein [Succinivibrio dextrinosolvens]|uniref:DUF6678 family protein n=1 Tax=Succinivibrio dextrinosolvens TaxID=83771 RepID=UPI00241C9C82|nr:DUF6678 family protein [Succinivibrio dextrinosolvens]MBE6423250.1 hypothetical protein [Succinivibrio dextrinosolvens]
MEQNLQKILFTSLNHQSGLPQPVSSQQDDQSSIQFQLVWKNGIAFTAKGWPHFGWFYVEKDKQIVSSAFDYRKIDGKTLSVMQHMIDEIEAGKYNHKKTPKDKIRDIVQSRQLAPCMNNTKWAALIGEISKIEALPIKYKRLTEDTEPTDFWTIDGDEFFGSMESALIEWLKISCVIEKSEYHGQLIPHKISEVNVRAEIESILKRYSINYEYDEIDNSLLVHGYR